MIKRNRTIRFLFCLICIIIVSLIFDELLYEKKLPLRIVKHIGNLIWLASVLLIGIWAFKILDKKNWVVQIWRYSYCGVGCILIVLGAVDALVGGFNENIKDAIGYTRFFFTSPVPFAILWMLIFFEEKMKV